MRRYLLLILLLCPVVAGCSPVVILNATVPSDGVELVQGVRYAEGPRGTMDLYRPVPPPGAAVQQALPVVVFLYGGYWRSGNKGMYPFVGRPLARRGVIVAVPDYRLYPEAGIAEIVQDNAKAVAWTLAHAAEYGGDPRRVFVMGHSAGAYNAAMVALNPAFLARAGSDRSRLAGMIGLAGPYDFLPITDPEVIQVFGPYTGPNGQPITYADGHAPPLLLRTGDADTTVNPRNTFSLAEKVQREGGQADAVAYPGLGHIGLITAFAPLFDGRAPVLDDVARFVKGGAARPGMAWLGAAPRAAAATP